jgi:periplasmic protein TonB
VDALRLILKKYRFSIAFTLSIGLHFFAFFICPHLNQKESSKGETLLTYEVALLEPSICTSDEVLPISMLQEVSMSDVVQEISPEPLQEIIPAIIKEKSIDDSLAPELIKDVQPIDENALPQKIETPKTETPKPIKKPVSKPVKPKPQQIPKTEIIPKKTFEQPKNVKQTNTISSKNELNNIHGHENTSHHQQNTSLGNNEHEAPIMPIEKAKLRGKLIMPPYPKRAFDMGLEGEVTLQVLIDKNAQIKDIKIIRHKGNRLFCTSALNTIKEKWSGLIEPHQQNSQFIDGWIEITIPFTIERK